MNAWKRVLAVGLLSIMIAAGLLLTFRLNESAEQVYADKAEAISEQNMVDVLSETSLHLRIRRVELSESIISVDLLAGAKADAETIVRDMYELPRHLFNASTNINQVLVRVIDGSVQKNGNLPLLTAVDARRTRWVQNAEPLGLLSVNKIASYLEENAEVTYTPAWKSRFYLKSM